MKLLALADSHLMLSNRMDDFLDSLYQISKIAESKKIDKIIHLGDVYHKRLPHPKEQEAFRMWLKSLPCPIDIVVGNHDENLDTHTLNELEIFDSIGIKVLHPPVIMEENGMKIYLDHTLIEGAKLGPSNLTLNISHSVSKKYLLSKNCDLYLFGHIHKYQVLNENPPMIYVGSIDRVDFAERDETKGVIVVDTCSKTVERILLDTRPMIQLDISAANFDISSIEPQENAIVKLVVKGSKEDISKLDISSIRSKLGGVFSLKEVFEIEKETRKINNSISEQFSIERCFLEYATKNNFSEETIEEGKRILNECEKN